jgi:hypothetical protein
MNILFKDMQVGAIVYALLKGDELKYVEGTIVSVSQPRVDVPQVPVGQMPMTIPSVKNVVDVTYQLDGKNYTDAVDVTATMFPTEKTGCVTLVSTEKDAIVRELHATMKVSENYLAEADRQIPKQKKRLKECKELIARLDTAFKDRQETEQRFAKLEEAQREQGSKLDKIIALLKK